MIPGRLLCRFAIRICSARALEQVVEPAIADLQKEYADTNGRALRRGWLLIVGYIAVWRVMVHSISARFVSTSDDKAALTRALSIAAASMMAITVLLMIPPITGWEEYVSPSILALVVPQAVPLAIPLGLVLGLAFGLSGRALSSAAARTMLLAALLCSAISFATLAWVLPSTNQQFRQQLFESMGHRGTVMKGLNEMSFSELDAEAARVKTQGNERGARQVSWYYHLKSSLAVAPFVLAVFALATVWRGRVSPRALILLSPVAYWLLMLAGEWLGIRGSTPPPVGAWLPNIAFATIAVILTSRSPRPRVL